MAFWSVIGRFACGVVVFLRARRPRQQLLQAEQKLITFGMIGAYLEKTGAHNGRLRFFEAHYPASPFYQHVAKRLLSMRTAGSISVERAAKPMKNYIMTKTRNKLKKEKGNVCLRAGLNMRLLYGVKKGLTENAADSSSDSEGDAE